MWFSFFRQISTSLGKATPPSALTDETAREIKEGDPFKWLSNNTHIGDILHHVQNKNLSEYVIEFIKEHSLDEETDCLQLLICKLSPFVTTMQESLRKKADVKENGNGLLFKYLPSLEDVREVGDKCEVKHPYCKLIY